MNPSAIMRYKEDEILLRQGDLDHQMYKILSGKAAAYVNYGQPDEYLLGVLGAQSCFGEITLLCGKPSIYTVVALEEILLLSVNEENFENFIQNNSRNAIDIMKNLAKTTVNLSFNINQLSMEIAELAQELSRRGELNEQRLDELNARLRSFVNTDTTGKAMFTLSV